MNIQLRRLLAGCLVTASMISWAQDPFFDDFNKSLKDDYDNFLKEAREEYNNFREEANKAYADFLAAPWEPIRLQELERPKENTRPPQPLKEDDNNREDHSFRYDKVVKPTPPKPQPEPIDPIVVKPREDDNWLSFTYLGNSDRVRVPGLNQFSVKDVSEKGVASSWRELSAGAFDATLADCLALRKKYNLPDWAYLNLLDLVASKIFPYNKNEATLLTAWLYSQSGYQMRLASAGNNLVMMFATDHVIYGSYYKLDGTNYYPFKCNPASLSLSHASFPNEKLMSLVLTSLPKTNCRLSSPTSRQSKRYPEMKYDVSVDENLIEFFNTYPNSQIGQDMMTRWAIYANTPMSQEVKDQLYPQMSQHLASMSDREKVERILNWVQTGFVYEYDDVVWGGDRAFFPDETIYYPYADCEDRAILFTRLVRDLVGLDAILVCYPNHLSSAIAFNNAEEGDYITLNGRRFTVCDPTFINAPVGRTAKEYNNASATVILLDRK